MINDTHKQYLRTKYVFLDTQAFIQQRFDWTGPDLSKLVELAQDGHLKLLMNDITRGEVLAKLRDDFKKSVVALNKYQPILKQFGGKPLLDSINNAEACSTVEAGFSQFLKDTKAENVPLSAELKDIFIDYFNRRPPFHSEKKKAEFPDAFVVSSLQAWCKTKKTNAYVVSGDCDFKLCCSEDGPLYYLDSVRALISHATVSKELHDNLTRTLGECVNLKISLAEHVEQLRVNPWRGGVAFMGQNVSFTGYILSAVDIEIVEVNVLKQKQNYFLCEIEFEVHVFINFDLIFEGYTDSYREEVMPRSYMETTKGVPVRLSADIELLYDQATPGKVEIQSTTFFDNSLNLSFEEVFGVYY